LFLTEAIRDLTQLLQERSVAASTAPAKAKPPAKVAAPAKTPAAKAPPAKAAAAKPVRKAPASPKKA
jgi:topoisomerase IA-like protein